MTDTQTSTVTDPVANMDMLASRVSYSFTDTLNPDPDATDSGVDYLPRQVFSGHYVPVKPTPLANPRCIAHSPSLFRELGFDERLANNEDFVRLFSGDLSGHPTSIRRLGWATGYALSIYGTEYIQQCPFQTGNGYGDGRAISILEMVSNGKRREMQLKGAGPTPYCRGADGRAVLRSSVREFLAQEFMHALGVPTSRSLSLIVSETETVDRPWYREGSVSENPEVMVENPVAISTRVASSFIRVGQLELFSRRARSQQHPDAMKELRALVEHLIEREYREDISPDAPFNSQLIQLAESFQQRLAALVTDWIRVGYCQGNFNSDNCAAGGYTLDYGPFGFCEPFDPFFQPWTGGGQHFSFLNQPVAAQKNFNMFCTALAPLLAQDRDKRQRLDVINEQFGQVIQHKMEAMWAAKLGLEYAEHDFVIELLQLMTQTPVDYTIFFHELSSLPVDISALSASFYRPLPESLQIKWQPWLDAWQQRIQQRGDPQTVANAMKQVNPRYTWREWRVAPAYQHAEHGDYSLVHELQSVLSSPYREQSEKIDKKYYQLRPREYFRAGGISHYSCSS